MATKQKRSKAMKVLMTENTHARLFELADLLGQPAATLASVAVSEYVARYMGQQSVQEKAMKATLDYLGPEFKEQLKIAAAS
jgi:predicted transcriptional regulator